jgi:hypothetical protein
VVSLADLLLALAVWGAIVFGMANYLSLQFFGKFTWEDELLDRIRATELPPVPWRGLAFLAGWFLVMFVVAWLLSFSSSSASSTLF